MEEFFDCIEPAEVQEPPVPQRPKFRLLEAWLNRPRLTDTPVDTNERPKPRLFETWLRRHRLSRANPTELGWSLRQSLRQLPEDATVCLECADCLGRIDWLGGEAFSEVHVANVTRAVRAVWEDRIAAGPLDEVLAKELADGFPELDDWTQEEVVRRMLRAACGHEKEATQMLVKAIDCRVRDRELFRSMECPVTCDMRVIGRDLEQRPALYVCARSQQLPLKELRSQIFVAFEAAVRLGSPDEQVVLIADMTGFSASLNVDPFVLKGLSESFGTVFADRLHSVMIVDFSLLAQTVWSTCKALLSERTRKKMNFVGERLARKFVQERFDAPTCERILSAFTINRLKTSTVKERQLQAQRTAISDVPLGRPAADKAG